MAINSNVQILRGSTEKASAYTGLIGELVYDTGKKTVRAMDGATVGGSVLAKEAIKLKTDAKNLLKFNDAAEADHSADISVTMDINAVSSEVIDAIKEDDELQKELSTNVVETIKNDDTLKGDVADAVIEGLTADEAKQDTLAELIADDLISTDEKNALKTGDDGLLFVKEQDVEALVQTADKVLFVNDDNQISTNLSFDIEEATNTLKLLGGKDGTTEVATIALPSGGLLEEAKLVQEKPVESGDPEVGEFIYLKFKLATGEYSEMYINVTKLVDIYTVGDGLKANADDNHKFEVNLASTGNQLKLNDSKEMVVPTDYGTLD